MSILFRKAYQRLLDWKEVKSGKDYYAHAALNNVLKVEELIVAKDMGERKAKMLELADAFVALPGGIGTLDEISEAITLTKIGVFHKKCVLFNRNDFYEPLRAMFEEMERAGFLQSESMDHVLFSDNLQEIQRFLE